MGVFISYSHTDSEVADQIAAVLEDLSVAYFRDVKNIDWGDNITTEVRDGLQAADAIIVIVSPGSLKSHWVSYEVGYGTALRKRILPYLTHPSLDPPEFMSELSYVKSCDDVRSFFTSSTDWSKPVGPAPNIQQPDDALSDAAAQLLVAAAKDKNGRIMKVRTRGGLTIQANGKNMVDGKDARTEARWESALNELAGRNYIEVRGTKGEVFAVTQAGFEAADRLVAG